MKATRTVWIEKKAALEFFGKRRKFPFAVNTERSAYVKRHEEDMLECKITLEHDFLNGKTNGCHFGAPTKQP